MTLRNSTWLAVTCLSFSLPLVAQAQAPTSPSPGEVAASPEYSPELVQELISGARDGDPYRGAVVFASPRFACIACHKVGEQGGNIGPDLSEVAKRRTAEYLVESLVWPKRQIDPEFRVHRIATADGEVLQGYLQSEDKDKVLLKDPATGKVSKIPVDDIDQRALGDTLMPEGLINSMSKIDKQDLISFLTQLGRDDGISAASVADLLQHATAHAHGPAKFAYTRDPLRPEDWPHRHAPINAQRLYDFYSKQAEHFRQQANVPPLLAEFPGVEGEGGDSEVRRASKEEDLRWNDTQGTPVLSGVFRAEKIEVPRGICVRLGDKGELGVCFNPETLCYEALWEGPFLKFSPVRHGFMDGLQPAGKLLPTPTGSKPSDPFNYQGFYRHGDRIVFAYRIGDVDYLDAPWVEAGEFQRIVAPAAEHPLRALTQGGQPRWPEEITCPIQFGKGRPYAVDTLSLPVENPGKDLIFCGGVAFLPEGAALVCTMQGDVWRADGFEAPSKTVRWRKVAAGLHQAQGIVADNDGVFVLGRDQITRLHDLNGDGEYDFHECFCNGYVTSTFGHDFVCGLERDDAGNFYTASSKQGLLQISPDGKTVTVIATGLRNPDGLGLLPDRTVTVPCSQGNWTPASMICAVRPPFVANGDGRTPPFFGYGGPKEGQPPELPLVYLPRGLDNSSGGQAVVDSDRWGPLKDQLLHFSYGASCHHLILRDEVRGQLQGAVVPLVGDFRSGIHRGRFRPQDGQLYVAGQSGWGAFTADDGCFERVRFTGNPVQLPVGFHVHENGVRIDFSGKLDPSVATNVKNHFAQCWNYRYSGAYGSPEFSPSHPGTPGHDPLTIQSAHLLNGDQSLFLEIPEIQPVNQLHLHLQVDDGKPQELFLTVHQLDQPFTSFSGYQAVAKTVRPHPIVGDLSLETKRVPNPWRHTLPKARLIDLKTAGNLQYAKKNLTAKAGETIQLRLTNADVVPHNWVLLKPGTESAVGQLSNQLVADPDAFARQYIPETDDILAYVDIVDPGKKSAIYFEVPNVPGKYPYLCTFPGHWTVMQGTLTVTK